jgi:hypothetical protein
MVEKPKTLPAASPQDSGERPLSATRRRWLQAGLSAPPVMMTLLSRPVLAAQQCVAPSAFVSLGASGPGTQGQCTGNGPLYWQTNLGSWTATGYCPGSPGCTPATPFYREGGNGGVFYKPSPATYFNGQSLLDVLKNSQTGGAYDVGRYLVAALLNSAASYVPASVLPKAAILDMWREYAMTGYGHFTPSAGAQWSGAEIVDYLKSTMISG